MESGALGQTSIHAPLTVVVVSKQEPINVLGLVVVERVYVLKVRLVIRLIVPRVLAKHPIQ